MEIHKTLHPTWTLNNVLHGQVHGYWLNNGAIYLLTLYPRFHQGFKDMTYTNASECAFRFELAPQFRIRFEAGDEAAGYARFQLSLHLFLTNLQGFVMMLVGLVRLVPQQTP